MRGPKKARRPEDEFAKATGEAEPGPGYYRALELVRRRGCAWVEVVYALRGESPEGLEGNLHALWFDHQRTAA